MSPIPSLPSSCDFRPLPPILTITPATLVFPLSPPLTPVKATTIPVAPSSAKSFKVPPTPPPTRASPYVAAARVKIVQPIPTAQCNVESVDTAHSLHYPLTRHLALMHPNTPYQVIDFIATRLLSCDRPYGHPGSWTPVWTDCGDLATAGLGREAGKGCRQRSDGEGKKRDERMEQMYAAAKESFRRLELETQGVEEE